MAAALNTDPNIDAAPRAYQPRYANYAALAPALSPTNDDAISTASASLAPLNALVRALVEQDVYAVLRAEGIADTFDPAIDRIVLDTARDIAVANAYTPAALKLDQRSIAMGNARVAQYIGTEIARDDGVAPVNNSAPKQGRWVNRCGNFVYEQAATSYASLNDNHAPEAKPAPTTLAATGLTAETALAALSGLLAQIEGMTNPAGVYQPQQPPARPTAAWVATALSASEAAVPTPGPRRRPAPRRAMGVELTPIPAAA